MRVCVRVHIHECMIIILYYYICGLSVFVCLWVRVWGRTYMRTHMSMCLCEHESMRVRT